MTQEKKVFKDIYEVQLYILFFLVSIEIKLVMIELKFELKHFFKFKAVLRILSIFI